MSTDATVEWESLLDRLEEEAERMLAAGPDHLADTVDADDLSWTAPAASLPPHLADRAQRVVRLQRSAMERAQADMGELRRHLHALGRVPADRRPDAPAYLDVNG